MATLNSYLISTSILEATANAIRVKNKDVDEIAPSGFAAAIKAIETGGVEGFESTSFYFTEDSGVNGASMDLAFSKTPTLVLIVAEKPLSGWSANDFIGYICPYGSNLTGLNAIRAVDSSSLGSRALAYTIKNNKITFSTSYTMYFRANVEYKVIGITL